MPSSTGPIIARIRWDDRGQPISTHYDDVYFSRHNGLEETRYVFLEQNALGERWRSGFDGNTFYIGETGFGSGLNFLAAWQLWAQVKLRDKRLHFVSVENEPLHKSDLRQALALWPELAEPARELLAVYPQVLLPGFHEFDFSDHGIKLTLIIAEATAGLNQLLRSEHPLHRRPFHRGMDAWFLDGFAPAKNPAMWQPTLFDAIAALSARQASLATFTAAGSVKRELQRVGFRCEKRPGYGRKRDMTVASFVGNPSPETEDFPETIRNSPHPIPWHVNRDKSRSGDEEKAAIVVGAGLAGSHTARALAKRGWRVTVLDRASDVANGASGNAQGIVYGKLSGDADGLALFNRASLLYAQRFYEPYWESGGDIGEQCGLLQLAFNHKEIRIRRQLHNHFSGADDFLRFLEPVEASDIAGIKINWPAVFFPRLGWLNPVALCRALLDHANITVQCDTNVAALTWGDGSPNDAAVWKLSDARDQTIARASHVVIANAHHALDFPIAQHLPLKPIRGQVSCFQSERIPIKTVLCSEGYLAPANGAADPLQSFGATFTLHEQRNAVLRGDHEQNLANLAATLPALAGDLASIDPTSLSGRTGFRCTTADYLPLVGPVPDYPRFVKTFAALSKNAKAAIASPGPYWPGLYLNVGHGSRGLAYTPLAAQMLAACMNGDLIPMPRDLATALNPARFIIRDLIRNRLTS